MSRPIVTASVLLLATVSSGLTLGCKPKVAGPEVPAPADVIAWSHCADPVAIEIRGPGGTRTQTLRPDTQTPMRLEPGEEVSLAAAPEKPVAVRKSGGSVVVGSSCRTLVGSDLGGLDDPG